MVSKRTFTIDDVQEFANICAAGDFHLLEGSSITSSARLAPKKWHKDLVKEWQMLLRQQGDCPALCFAVQVLTTFLRRGVDFDKNYANFNRLWGEHRSFLLNDLSSRWLVSTLDTYTKRPRNAQEEAWAFMGAFFMKTIKLYETENLRQEAYPDLRKAPSGPDIDRMREKHGRVMLFDGMQSYNVLHGDMIDKMGKRLLRVESDELCYQICRELWNRAHRQQTIYRRMARAKKEL